VRKVWIFSFECAGVVKVGGLGEAVYNIAKHLANRGLEVTVFMPSHGVSTNPALRESLALHDSNKVIKGSAREENFLPYRSPFRYSIGIQTGHLSGFNVVLFHGSNDATTQILDNEAVYKSNLIEDKSLLLARGISGYIEHLKDSKREFPDVIHAHDYHSVPAATLAKQKLEDYDHKAALVFTIHLLSSKRTGWNYLGQDWCGIRNRPHRIYFNDAKVETSHRAVLRRAHFKLEAFCAAESHVLASVSQNYLQDEVIPQVGQGCEGKTAFHWNGCDWDHEKMLEEVVERFGADVKSTLGLTKIERSDLRKYFLTKALGNLRSDEPILEGEKVRETVAAFKTKPFTGNGRFEPFKHDGPMVLMTGRLGEQKGVDILFRAIPHVLEKVADTKFVLLLLPLEEEADLINQSARLMSKYPETLRIVLGKAPSIYSLAHLASDVFVCPSKWEPFGIMALEAMATGNPIIATAVGGLKEIVSDVTQDLENGTGILVPKNDFESLGEALSSLIAVMQISEISQRAAGRQIRSVQEVSKAISNDQLREAVLRQPHYGFRLRGNAIRRVETTFRWNKTIGMVINAYEKAINLSNSL
jgi:starch synthase